MQSAIFIKQEYFDQYFVQGEGGIDMGWKSRPQKYIFSIFLC